METLMKGKYFTNKKHGNTYCVLGLVVNTTNDRDGQDMVLYAAIKDGKLVKDPIFCREYVEFKEKFTESILKTGDK